MESLTKDLAVAIVGAVIGAALVYLFSIGFRVTKESGEVRRAMRAKENDEWQSGDALKRQRIFNSYLFSVLRYFIVGNILIALATTMGDLDVRPQSAPLTILDYVYATFDMAGVLFYLVTFSQILRFTKLLRLGELARG